jgi:hypothetical protein
MGEERAIVKLKARRLLSDVDVDRSPRECSGDCQREVPDEHMPSSWLWVQFLSE